MALSECIWIEWLFSRIVHHCRDGQITRCSRMWIGRQYPEDNQVPCTVLTAKWMSLDDRMLCCRGLEWNWQIELLQKGGYYLPSDPRLPCRSGVSNDSWTGELKFEIRESKISLVEEKFWLELYPGLDPDTPNHESVPEKISEGSGSTWTTVTSEQSKPYCSTEPSVTGPSTGVPLTMEMPWNAKGLILGPSPWWTNKVLMRGWRSGPWTGDVVVQQQNKESIDALERWGDAGTLPWFSQKPTRLTGEKRCCCIFEFGTPVIFLCSEWHTRYPLKENLALCEQPYHSQ